MNHLAKAKATIVLDHPFYASLLLHLPLIEDAACKTLATNGDEIRYNPEFMAKLDLQETVFALAHELMHCVFEHMDRRGTRDALKWNMAGDYIINELLVKDRVGRLIPGCLYDTSLCAKGNGTTEGVYGVIPDSAVEKAKQGGGEGLTPDDCEDAPGDAAKQAEKRAERKIRVVNAKNAAKACGKLSAGLARYIDECLEPVSDWRAILRRFVSERARTDLSYARPKRRSLAEDTPLPSLQGEKLGYIAIAVDCSGSVDDRLLALFNNEIQAICEDTHPTAVRVIYFDSKVLRVDDYSGDESVTLNPCGGGGTAFSPIWQHLNEASLVVVLTDLQCYDFGEAPSCPVLWASTDRTNAPFGEVLRIKE